LSKKSFDEFWAEEEAILKMSLEVSRRNRAEFQTVKNMVQQNISNLLKVTILKKMLMMIGKRNDSRFYLFNI
jgi:hypothetical protein